jgi:hypothetical protein
VKVFLSNPFINLCLHNFNVYVFHLILVSCRHQEFF